MATEFKIFFFLFLVSSTMADVFPMPNTDLFNEMRSTVKGIQQALSQQAWALYQMLELSRQYQVCAQAPCCPVPFSKVMDECFYLSPHNLTWQQARQHCRGMDGDLASPKRVYALKSFVLGETASSDSRLFVGGHRVDGFWRWVNGGAINPTDWSKGYPSNWTTEVEHCATMWGAQHPPLFTRPCSTPQRFVCQHGGLGQKPKEPQ